jgi:hypothetical protein
MKNKRLFVKIVIVLLIILQPGLQIAEDIPAMPVVDFEAIELLLDQLKEILEKYGNEIELYREIYQEKNEYFKWMKRIIFRSESIFRAIENFPTIVSGQFELNPYFYDRLKKDIWGDLFSGIKKIAEQYPEFGDFSYIKNNPLYEKSETFRRYADRVLEIKKEENKEMENEFGIMKYMKEFQEEEARFLEEFKDVIIPAYGAGDSDDEAKKVVDVTKLYYAIGKIKLEVIKQKIEMLLMEKEELENILKKEINEIRYWSLSNEYYNTEVK